MAPRPILLPGLQDKKETSITEGIRLNSFKIEKFCHTFIIGLQKLSEDVVVHGGPDDFGKSRSKEEVHLEGQDKDSLDANLSRPNDEFIEQKSSDPLSRLFRIDPQRADLGEVLPDHVQGSTTDHVAVTLGDQEIRYILV